MRSHDYREGTFVFFFFSKNEILIIILPNMSIFSPVEDIVQYKVQSVKLQAGYFKSMLQNLMRDF